MGGLTTSYKSVFVCLASVFPLLAGISDSGMQSVLFIIRILFREQKYKKVLTVICTTVTITN